MATPDPRWLAASGDVVIRSHLLEHRQRTFPPPWPVKFFLCVYDDDTSHGASFSVTSHNYFGRAINVLLPRTEKGQLTFSKNKKKASCTYPIEGPRNQRQILFWLGSFYFIFYFFLFFTPPPFPPPIPRVFYLLPYLANLSVPAIQPLSRWLHESVDVPAFSPVHVYFLCSFFFLSWLVIFHLVPLTSSSSPAN